MKKIIRTLFAGALVTASIAGLASCGKESDDVDVITVKVGVCGGNNLHWNACQKELDNEDSGIVLEMVSFSAYNLPNQALANKEIDMNSFQHQIYLNNEVTENGYKIETIAQSLNAPLSIYSSKYQSIEELKNGNGEKKIGIPADATNQGRALKVLEAAGLITVDASAGYLPTTKDILTNPYNLTIVPNNANSLTSVYADYAACLINGTYAIPFGLIPSRDALYVEQQSFGDENPYNNVIVVRSEDKNNRVYKQVAKAFQSQLVAEFIVANYNEAFTPAFEYNSSSFTYFDANDEASRKSFVDEITKYKSKYADLVK